MSKNKGRSKTVSPTKLMYLVTARYDDYNIVWKYHKIENAIRGYKDLKKYKAYKRVKISETICL